MPAYGTKAIPTALYFGDQNMVWNNEIPAAGAKSERVAICGSLEGLQSFVRVELHWPSAPGAFQVDIQTADTDNDAYFTTQSGTSMTAVCANFTSSFQYEFVAKFLRLVMTTPSANAVALTAQITR